MKNVVIYSSDNCPNCDQLKKALTARGVDYDEIDVRANPEHSVALREKGFRQLPVIEDNGKWMGGFTRENFLSIVKPRLALA